MYTLGFIGCGNMGGALARAVAKAVDGQYIAVNDYCMEKAQAFAKECSATVLSAQEIATQCKFIVLGVKPQNMQETVSAIKTQLQTVGQLNFVDVMLALDLNYIEIRVMLADIIDYRSRNQLCWNGCIACGNLSPFTVTYEFNLDAAHQNDFV